jgi:hypothetical protein
VFVNVESSESVSEKSMKNVKEAQFIVKWFMEISKKFPNIEVTKNFTFLIFFSSFIKKLELSLHIDNVSF